MNLYEHTIVARQDTSPSQLKQLEEKYSKIVKKNEGDVVKLDTRKNDPAVVFLGKRPKFLAQPGLKDKHRVVKITSLISAAEEEKYQ